MNNAQYENICGMLRRIEARLIRNAEEAGIEEWESPRVEQLQRNSDRLRILEGMFEKMNAMAAYSKGTKRFMIWWGEDKNEPNKAARGITLGRAIDDITNAT